MKQIFFIFLFVISGITLKAQTQQQKKIKIEGITIYSASGKPLEYSTVAIYKIPGDSLIAGSISDKKGEFSIEVFNFATIKVVISCIGFNYSGNIYAGAEEIGLYRSTNNGSTWTVLWDVPFFPTSLVINSSGHFFISTMFDGIYKSTNSGVTWHHLNFANELVWSLIIDESDNIYAGIELDGIYKSIDNGNS